MCPPFSTALLENHRVKIMCMVRDECILLCISCIKLLISVIIPPPNIYTPDIPDNCPSKAVFLAGGCDLGQYKMIFVTSAPYHGNLKGQGGKSSGIAGANALCQTHATNAGLDGTFLAWISNGSNGPASNFDRTSDRFPYYLFDTNGGVGARLADNWSDLTDGYIQNPINVDENGDIVPSGTRVWTGTQSDVTVGQGNQCNNWVAGGSNQYGSIGSTDNTDALWTYEGGTTARCNQEHHLYCFQQVDGAYSDGSAGDLIIDANGNLSLNGNTNDSRFLDSTTLGTAPDAITTFNDIDNFIIAAGQTANVLGTLVVKAKRTQIDGELNGTGGGYVGAVGDATAYGARALSGESPPDTNGHGQGGKSARDDRSGGGGGSHGKLLLLMGVMRLTSYLLAVESP